MEVSQGKTFYKAAPGMYLGTVIDLIEKPGVQTQWGLKNKVMFVWTLSHADGRPYLDPEGNPYQATAWVTSTMNPKSTQPVFRNMYKIIAGILNATPPVITSTEQIEALVIGKSNGLMITQEPNPQNPQEPYVNIVGIMPLAPGQVPPQAPANFVRAKNRPKQQAGPQGQPVATYAVPPSQPVAPVTNAVATPAAAPQPTAEQIAAFLAAQKDSNKVGF
jgi:hypothetical protein